MPQVQPFVLHTNTNRTRFQLCFSPPLPSFHLSLGVVPSSKRTNYHYRSYTMEKASTLPKYTLSLTTQEPESIAKECIAIEPSSPATPGNRFSSVLLKNLTGKVYKEEHIGWGGFADVFMGSWEMTSGAPRIKVAIKELRAHMRNNYKDPTMSQKALRREMRIWGNLEHPNIVLLHGIIDHPEKHGCYAMVCQWMSQRTIIEYLADRPNLNFRSRLNICIDIAHGLSYLHEQKVIHGDLSPVNVLMDADVAHLSDFGLSNVIAELQGPSFYISKNSGAVRWAAPELLRPTYDEGIEINPVLTLACDIYSFASVAFYVITGSTPYSGKRSDNIIAEIVLSTGRYKAPPKPAESLLTDACWDILMMCWALDPAERPCIAEIEHRLRCL